MDSGVQRAAGGDCWERPVTPLDIKVGARIRERREKLKIDRAVLAEAIGVTVSQLGRYERGDSGTSPEVLAKLAKALRCKAKDFLDGIDGR